MTNITISDLNPADSDSYMRELSDEELNALTGGFEVISYFIGLAVGGLFSILWDYFTN